MQMLHKSIHTIGYRLPPSTLNICKNRLFSNKNHKKVLDYGSENTD